MTDSIFKWQCPSCSEALSVSDGQLRCANKHSFDKAKEGYVNLLLAHNKKSKNPGDNGDMVSARRNFLAQGYYLPLANKVAELILKHLADAESISKPYTLFDAGCGEGYYIANIADFLTTKHKVESEPKILAGGIDISKPAIQKAAKKYKSTKTQTFNFAVASCFDLPLSSNSQNAILQIFAPAKDSEMLRVLEKKGIWIRVNPANEHLFELKSMVYDKPVKHEPDAIIPIGFDLLSQHKLRFDMTFTNVADRQNLLLMTPFYWTISETKKQKLLLNLTATKAHFDIQVLQKQ